MNQDIIEMWHKAWPDQGSFVRASAEDLETFAKLVAAREREACDELCRDIDGGDNMFARAIRARGEA